MFAERSLAPIHRPHHAHYVWEHFAGGSMRIDGSRVAISDRQQLRGHHFSWPVCSPWQVRDGSPQLAKSWVRRRSDWPAVHLMFKGGFLYAERLRELERPSRLLGFRLTDPIDDELGEAQ